MSCFFLETLVRPPCRRFAASVAFLLGVVVLENFCTWATSASDLRKYAYTPLQVGPPVFTACVHAATQFIRRRCLGNFPTSAALGGR